MDAATENLILGLSVNICRSDGRIHPATVNSVNSARSAVTVEWLEKSGQTKAKEIEISELWALNKELLRHMTRSNQPAANRIPEKNEVRVQPSRLPALSAKAPPPGPTEDTVPRRMTTRQTMRLKQPGPAPTVGPPAMDPLSEDGPLLTVPKPSGLASDRKGRNPLKPAAASAQVPASEVASESELAPIDNTSRRMTGVSYSASTALSKRTSVGLMYKEQTQNKRWKHGEMGRSKPFYQMIEEYRETVVKVPMSLSDPVEAHRICVCVRKRPLNKKELTKKEVDVVTIPGTGVLLFHEPKQKVDLTKYLENQTFHFDYSFDENTSNDVVYRFTARPLVQTIFEGSMATCFAYGQTGSGKTHTMGGDFSGKSQKSSKGIYALAAQDVFTLLQQRRYADMQLSPYVTFFEIYNGKVFDLLNKKAKLRVLEDENQQVQVVGLHEVPVASVDDVIKLIEKGSACRTSGQTFANANSSRSHAVLQIVLRRWNKLHGKFSLVDLAGNERGTDVSSNDRQTMAETAEINRSLLALKECIRSLGHNSEHIPFRMSKLTQVLRDSFIGENSKTCMIAMISPGMGSCEYTLNTLRYADRVKELKGASKKSPQTGGKCQEVLMEESCSSEEPSQLDYEAISQLSEMEERLYEELKQAGEVWKSMEDPTFSIVTGIGEIEEYVRRLQESCQAVRTSIQADEMVRTAQRPPAD